MSQITVRHTGQCIDCGEDRDVEATGDLRTLAFAAALLRAGRSRRRRGVTDVNAIVGPDVSTSTSHDWLVSLHRRPRQTRLPLSLLLNRHRQPVCR